MREVESRSEQMTSGRNRSDRLAWRERLRLAAFAALVLLPGLSRDAPVVPRHASLNDLLLPMSVAMPRSRFDLHSAAFGPSSSPQAPAPKPIPTRAEWSEWLNAANAGDPGAACRLALMLDDCRLARDVDEMVDTQLSMAVAEQGDSVRAAQDIAALQASVEATHARCAVLPDALTQHDGDFLLRAAIAGHEPSMLRYLADPPLAAASQAERAAALAAYRQNAGWLLDALLQRASPDALALAFRIAQGEEFVAGSPIRPRDPVAATRYGTALLTLRDDDVATLIGVETALSEIDAATAQQAETEGRRLAERFFQRQRLAATVSAGDECASGWPGRDRAVTSSIY